ncbi:hypothetical protein [Paraburkholderia caribensis]|uniref:hypothetical protein n=1 Tax=Paraburkholderia caribensis TaxID=75105 RepID=UPI00286A9FF7|nr:hypothetical protein [Paraburkholderia caribensis]
MGFFAVWEGATFYRIGGGRIAFGILVFRLRFAFVARAAWVAFGFAGIRDLLLLSLASAMRYLASRVAPVRGGTYFSLPPQRKVGKRKRLTPPVLIVA